MFKQLTTKWVVDAKDIDDRGGWVFNVADEDFETEADAMRWLESYKPYLGSSRTHIRAVERLA